MFIRNYSRRRNNCVTVGLRRINLDFKIFIELNDFIEFNDFIVIVIKSLTTALTQDPPHPTISSGSNKKPDHYLIITDNNKKPVNYTVNLYIKIFIYLNIYCLNKIF